MAECTGYLSGWDSNQTSISSPEQNFFGQDLSQMGTPGHFLLLETGAEAVASTAGVPNQPYALWMSRLVK
jgi:hypothetical protein